MDVLRELGKHPLPDRGIPQDFQTGTDWNRLTETPREPAPLRTAHLSSLARSRDRRARSGRIDRHVLDDAEPAPLLGGHTGRHDAGGIGSHRSVPTAILRSRPTAASRTRHVCAARIGARCAAVSIGRVSIAGDTDACARIPRASGQVQGPKLYAADKAACRVGTVCCRTQSHIGDAVRRLVGQWHRGNLFSIDHHAALRVRQVPFHS